MGSGATGGDGMENVPVEAAEVGLGEDFVAALITDLRLKMLPKPPLELGVLERLAGSWLELLPLPLISESIAPPITAAAPNSDDPMSPAAPVVGLSNRFKRDYSGGGKGQVKWSRKRRPVQKEK